MVQVVLCSPLHVQQLKRVFVWCGCAADVPTGLNCINPHLAVPLL